MTIAIVTAPTNWKTTNVFVLPPTSTPAPVTEKAHPHMATATTNTKNVFAQNLKFGQIHKANVYVILTKTGTTVANRDLGLMEATLPAMD